MPDHDSTAGSADDGRDRGPTQRSVEIGVASLIAVLAAIVIGGSLEAGIGWGAEGPQAGFVPFYVGLLILVSSAINLTSLVADRSQAGLFADWSQLRQVISVLVPTTAYVALVPWIGIYAASAVLIALFMRWLGRYGWGLVAVISLGVPLAIFVVFERWFLVPLPKGPIEAFLGF